VSNTSRAEYCSGVYDCTCKFRVGRGYTCRRFEDSVGEIYTLGLGMWESRISSPNLWISRMGRSNRILGISRHLEEESIILPI
jgi:hypothetical protein